MLFNTVYWKMLGQNTFWRACVCVRAQTKWEPCSVLQTHPVHHHAQAHHQQQPPLPQAQHYQHSSAMGSPVQEEMTDVNCRFCSKTFHGRYAKYNLKRHLMIHRGEKPFVCPYCPHRANQKGNLKYHILSVHPGLPATQVLTPVDGMDGIAKNENFASNFGDC